jgi:glycosyltransferase involved in cell wall biosynthesis
LHFSRLKPPKQGSYIRVFRYNYMIIAIDGYEANVTQRVGIGRYAYDILSNMHTILTRLNGSGYQVRVYLPSKPLPDMPKETPWWRYIVRGPSSLWTFIGLPLALLQDQPRADVVFSPTHYVPRFVSISRVMAIMDTSYLEFPQMFRPRDLYQLTHWTKYAVTCAKRIVTISAFSKNAIINAYKVPHRNVVVTYPGLSMTKSSNEDIFKKYHISKHFILSVGTIQPRKNYARLIEAFGKFLTLNKQKFGEIQLVIIGKKGWLYDRILETPVRLGLTDQVKFLHNVPDGDLPSFYQNALSFALPSLYEGFGLPVLEAMAYKCPVVVSNVSSIPEISGPAGVYVDPKDVNSIAQGLLTAVRQRNLMQGKMRIQKGLAQVKLFSWEKAAKQTLEVLTEVGRQRA